MDEREPEEQQRPRPRVVDRRISARADEAEATSAPQEQQPQPPPSAPSPEPSRQQASTPPAEGAEASGEPIWTPEQEAQAQQVAEQIASTPSLEWVVNTAVTLANVAATKLEMGAAADAQLAIDALAGLLNSTSGRLQQAETPLRQTLAQLQMAYAQRVSPPPEANP